MKPCSSPIPAILFGAAFFALHMPASVSAEQTDDQVAFSNLDAAVVSDKALNEERGRQGVPDDFQYAISDQSAIMDNNSLAVDNGSKIINGENTLSGLAFSEAKGFMTVIQNTGNQVVIQESTSVNIRYAP